MSDVAKKFSVGTDSPFVGHHTRTAIVHDLAPTEEQRQLVPGGNMAKYLGIPRIDVPD